MSDTRDQMDSRPPRQDGDGAPEPRKDGEDRGPGGPRRGKGFFKKKVCEILHPEDQGRLQGHRRHAPLRNGARQDPATADHRHLRQTPARPRHRHQAGEGAGLPPLRREIEDQGPKRAAMSDPVTAFGRKPYAAPLAAGLASSLLFLSVILSFAFLLPIQIVFGRFGRRTGGAAAGIRRSVSRSSRAGGSPRRAPRARSRSRRACCRRWPCWAPFVLVNAPLWRGLAAAYKVLAVTAACALCALPLLIAVERDASFAGFLEKLFGDFLSPLRSALGEGYEASALAASLDPKDLVATFLATLRDSYAAVLALLYRRQLEARQPTVGTGQPGQGGDGGDRQPAPAPTPCSGPSWPPGPSSSRRSSCARPRPFRPSPGIAPSPFPWPTRRRASG